MAALLSVHHLPIVFSIHGERPSMTGLAYHNIYIILPSPMMTGIFCLCAGCLLWTYSTHCLPEGINVHRVQDPT